MKRKGLDCVEMKRQGAIFVQGQLAGKTREQELEFWKQQSQQLALRRQQAIRRATHAVS